MCLVCGSYAEDVLQVVPFKTTAGIVENEWEQCFTVNMTNTNVYTAMQFDIYLPSGMTLIDDEPMELSSLRFPGVTKKGVFIPNHDVNITNPEPGHYFVKIYNVDLEPIEGTEGELLSFYYLTSADMTPGVYPIRVEGTVLGIDGHTGVYPETSVSYVTIGEPAANTVYNLGGTADEQLLVPSFVQSALDTETNVVVNGTCENLVLSDGANYVAGSSFTAASATYNATVSESLGYKTIVLPYAVDVPAGFEAYTVGSVVGNELTMNAVSTIPANTPAILKNAGTAVMAASNVAVEATGDVKPTDGVLVGTYEAINAPVGSYVLQNHDGNVAFYNVTEAVQPVVGAFRAYLSVPSGEARIRMVFDGEASGIEKNVTSSKGDAIYYNLAGQRVSKFAKGVVISNGHKLIK